MKENLKQYKEAAEKIQQSVEFMQKIQADIKELNRPVSAKVEDVQNMLGSYEVRVIYDFSLWSSSTNVSLGKSKIWYFISTY